MRKIQETIARPKKFEFLTIRREPDALSNGRVGRRILEAGRGRGKDSGVSSGITLLTAPKVPLRADADQGETVRFEISHRPSCFTTSSTSWPTVATRAGLPFCAPSSAT